MPDCVAHGDTPEEALHEARAALEGHLAVMAEEGIEPEPSFIQFIRRLNHLGALKGALKGALIARKASINEHTFRSKIKRGTSFTHEETDRIEAALQEIGL